VAKLRVTRWVPDDLAEAIDWYENKSLVLGNRFRAAVDAAFDAIKAAPESFPLAFPELSVRFYRLRRFPYIVLYRVDKSVVVVIGIRHGASDPEQWRRRVEA
jgi:plasmid stabilization system protein ParE